MKERKFFVKLKRREVPNCVGSAPQKAGQV